jgi:hypothetical protein
MRLPAALLLVLALSISAAPAPAQNRGQGGGDVGAWFDDASHGQYASAEPRVEQAAGDAARAGVPEGLLIERLDEGAAKQVAAPVLERALQEDAARLATIAALVDGAFPRLAAGERTDALREGAIALRAGMTADTVGRAIEWTAGSGQEPGRTMAALATVASLGRAVELDDSKQLALVQALVRSREPPSRYGSFVSLLSAARARGLDSGAVVSKTLAALSARGTFLAVQQELERALRR